MGHRGDQLAASTEDLKRTSLDLAADEINDSVRIPNLFLKALSMEVIHFVCAKVTHKLDIIRGCARDGSYARAPSQLDRSEFSSVRQSFLRTAAARSRNA
jgi:hypothetical protein